MEQRARSIPLVAAALLACSGAVEPCVPESGCVTPQPDLLVSSVEVVTPLRDPVTGLPVVSPDAIDVRFAVRNGGSGGAPAAGVAIEMRGRALGFVPIPALAPGRTHTSTVRLQSGLGRFVTGTDTMSIEAIAVALEPELGNNARTSGPFHVALPVVQLESAFDSLKFTVNVSAPARVTVANLSRHAALPSSTLGFCFHELGMRCREDDGATPLARLDLPAVPAGQSRALTVPITVGSGAAHQNQIDAYHLSTCIGAAELDASGLLDERRRDCAAPLVVTVRPDYETCEPPLLQPDVPASSSPVCVRPCPIFVYAVDVQPGYTYRVVRANGTEDSTLRWRTRFRDDVVDTSPEPGLQPATAARVYAVSALRFCESALVARQVVLRRTGGPAARG
jgi:hypothetical protein